MAAIALSAAPMFCATSALGKGPNKSLVAFGYAGWGPSQLEDEIAHGVWVTVPEDPALVFDDDRAKVWADALAPQKSYEACPHLSRQHHAAARHTASQLVLCLRDHFCAWLAFEGQKLRKGAERGNNLRKAHGFAAVRAIHCRIWSFFDHAGTLFLRKGRALS